MSYNWEYTPSLKEGSVEKESNDQFKLIQSPQKVKTMKITKFSKQRPLVGIYVGSSEGKYGPNFQFKDEYSNEMVTILFTVNLAQKMKQIKIGSKVKLYWHGYIKSSTGRDMINAVVYVASNDSETENSP